MRRWLLLAPPLAVLIGLLVWAQSDPARFLAGLRERAFDAYQRISPRPWRDAGVRLIAIDEASLEAFGRWPWPRDRIAELVERAADGGASAIAFAVLFSEEDAFEADARLAQAAERIPVVLGMLLADTARTAAPDPKASFAYSGALSDNAEDLIPDYLRGTGPLEPLAERAAGLGSITLPAEEDGVTRRAPTVQIALLAPEEQPDRPPREHATLFVETLRAVQEVPTVQVRVAGGANELNPFAENRIVALKIGDQAFFTDETGAARLHFSGPQAQRVISARDILDGQALSPRIDLKGKVLVVGATAEGLSEPRVTPLGPIDGPLLHVEAIEQALLPRAEGGGFLRRPDWALGSEMLLAAMFGFAVMATAGIAARWRAVIAFGAATLAITGSWGVFELARLLIDPVLPAAAATLVFAVSAATQSVVEERSRAEIRAAFERYMDPRFVKQLTESPESLTLGHGEVRDVTVMYCDIRDFAALTADLKDQPRRLSRLLSDFLTEMSTEIKNERGAIDKFMGDCVMALWNAPLPQEDHAHRACRAARKMRAALERLNRRLAAKGEEPLAMSIGIESGECVVGNMGTEDRFDFTAIGAAATLAARLQAEAARRTVDVLVGPGTRERLGDAPELLSDYGALTPRGWTEELPIYRLN